MKVRNLIMASAIILAQTSMTAGAINIESATPTVQNGSATITNSNKTINQTTARVDIDWTGFDTTAGQTVTFNQPSASAIAINRISGSATDFAGTLNANGRVVLINPAGFTFANGSAVNAGALVATTSSLPISDSVDSPNSITLYRSTKNAGSIVNNGTIKVPAGGNVAFVAPTVTNTGTITQKDSKLGAINVDIYGGEFRTVTFGTAPLISYSVPASKLANIAVTNSGTINAGGGTVVLTATDTVNLANSVMNLSGMIDSSSLSSSKSGGSIYMNSAGSITSSATIDVDAASNSKSSTKGGNVIIKAGKDVTITGDISANAGDKGAGGAISVTSNTGDVTKGDASDFYAKGGVTDGKGGTITLAAKSDLVVGGILDASAPKKGSGGKIRLTATEDKLKRRHGLNLNVAGGNDSTEDFDAGMGGEIIYKVKNDTKLVNVASNGTTETKDTSKGLRISGSITVNASPRSDAAKAGSVSVDYSTGTDVKTSCTLSNSGC